MKLESIAKLQNTWMVEGYRDCGSVDIPASGELCSDPWGCSEEVTVQRGEEDQL